MRIWIDQEQNGKFRNVCNRFPFDWPNLHIISLPELMCAKLLWNIESKQLTVHFKNLISLLLGIVLGLEEHQQKQYIYHLAFVEVFLLAPSFLPICLFTT